MQLISKISQQGLELAKIPLGHSMVHCELIMQHKMPTMTGLD